MIRPLIAAAAAFGIVLSAQVAAAGTAGSQMMVQSSDLDLASPQGQRELDRRIDRAARKVCTVAATTGTQINRVNRSCYTAAVASVRQNLTLADRTTR